MALNILVVDDSETVRAVIVKTIGLTGVDVNEIYQAGNGEEALTLLKDSWIDLVFSDINMPVMTGTEMVEIMKTDDMLKTIPVVIISTEGSATRIEELKSKGVSAYIRKPFSPETVKEVIDEIIGGSQDGS